MEKPLGRTNDDANAKKQDDTYLGMAAELVLIGFVSKASEEAIPMTASKAILLNIMVKYLIRIFCKENERSE
jgi:hypothetical protein